MCPLWHITRGRSRTGWFVVAGNTSECRGLFSFLLRIISSADFHTQRAMSQRRMRCSLFVQKALYDLLTHNRDLDGSPGTVVSFKHFPTSQEADILTVQDIFFIFFELCCCCQRSLEGIECLQNIFSNECQCTLQFALLRIIQIFYKSFKTTLFFY